MDNHTFSTIRDVTDRLTGMIVFQNMLLLQLRKKASYCDIMREIGVFIDEGNRNKGSWPIPPKDTIARGEFLDHLTRHLLGSSGCLQHYKNIVGYLEDYLRPLDEQKRLKIGLFKSTPFESTPNRVKTEADYARELTGNSTFLRNLDFILSRKAASSEIQSLIRSTYKNVDWSKLSTLSITVWIHYLLKFPSTWDYLNLPTPAVHKKEKETVLMKKAPFFKLSPEILGAAVDITDAATVIRIIADKEAEIKQMKQTTAQPDIVKAAIEKAEAELKEFVDYLNSQSPSAAAQQ